MAEFAFEKHNPWWGKSEAIAEDITLAEFRSQLIQYRHPFLDSYTSKPAVYTLRGPRRIGKTTLVKLIIEKLLNEKGTEPSRIFFYPCNLVSNFNELYDVLVEYLGRTGKEKTHIFLDEITFVEEWQRAVKDLWDSGDLRNCTLLLTGSNALDLEFSSERLPGRRGTMANLDVRYLPLSFAEFVHVVSKHTRSKKLFEDYLLCGGFPQAINEYFQKGFIPNHIYEGYLQWIEGDLHRVGKSETLMYAICGEILKSLGSRTSWYSIAKDTGISAHSTISDYIEILDKLFVLCILNYFSVDERKVYLGKNKKVYFIDPIILHAIRARVDGFTDSFFSYAKDSLQDEIWLPAVIENTVAHHLKTRAGELYYGVCKNKEVDFVHRHKKVDHYYEVKYRTRPRLGEFDFWTGKEVLKVLSKDMTFKKATLEFIPVDEFLKTDL